MPAVNFQAATNSRCRTFEGNTMSLTETTHNR
ncbi:MAG: hypothetical protein ACI8RE_002164, partial [Ilumatobacter sp.]